MSQSGERVGLRITMAVTKADSLRDLTGGAGGLLVFFAGGFAEALDVEGGFEESLVFH